MFNISLHSGLFPLILCAFLWIGELSSQRPLSVDTSSISPVDTSMGRLLMSAELATYLITDDGHEWDTLQGQVVLQQDSTYLSCDFAIVKDQSYANANGSIVINQNDEVFIYADTAQYDGISQTAKVYSRVVLDNKTQQLHTPTLFYDLVSKIASYDQGGIIKDDHSELISRRGTFDNNTRKAVFHERVRYQDTSRVMRTDSLIYDYGTRVMYIISPIEIQEDQTTIWSNEGVYNTKSGNGVMSGDVKVIDANKTIRSQILEIDADNNLYRFLVHPSIVGNDYQAQADTIIYLSKKAQVLLLGNAIYSNQTDTIHSSFITYSIDAKTYETLGLSRISQGHTEVYANSFGRLADDSGTIATDRVLIIDHQRKSKILADTVKSYQDTGITIIYGRGEQATLLNELDSGDTLLLRADTLHLLETDSTNLFQSIGNVKWLLDSIYGHSQSMNYESRDSSYIMTGRPIIWQDSIQLTADTILINMSAGQIESITLSPNALIVKRRPYDHAYDQISGKKMVCRFIDQKLETIHVDQNAELLYYVDKDGQLDAINSSASGNMLITLNNQSISRIELFNNPQSELYEYQQGADLSAYNLSSFEWLIDLKPQLSIFDTLIMMSLYQ